MRKRQLKRSLEYMDRVRDIAADLKSRYRQEIADAFWDSVKSAENRLLDVRIGTPAPYHLADQNVVLHDYFFKAGAAEYRLIFTSDKDTVGLVTIWLGRKPAATMKAKRTPGYLEGKIKVSDDFDPPLPDEILNSFGVNE